MGKKVIIPRTTKNHHQKTSKPFKPSNNVDHSHRQKNSNNNKDKDNNSLSLIKVIPPKVYIIDKSSFKSKVQQLTGYVGTAPSPAPDTNSFTDLYFHDHFEGTPSNSFPCSSMNDFAGYNSLSDNYSQTASPESMSLSSLDSTLSEVYNPSNELFSLEDLESWILDMAEPEPEVSIYDYELSGLIL